MPQILVVEDNNDLAFGLRNNFEIEGYEVWVESNGKHGLDKARMANPDLIILDLMLPGLDGFRFHRELRWGGSDVPVLILTARGEEADKVRGLKLGADDYVTKPFGVLELIARVEALLRRSERFSGAAPAPDAVERIGDIEINQATRTVHRGGEPVALTPKEFELLTALLRRRGAAASRLDVMQEVWGYSSAVVSRTVDTHIAELRRKLEDEPSSPKHILTVRKHGYRLHRENGGRRSTPSV